LTADEGTTQEVQLSAAAAVLVVSLAFNAALVITYRTYRLSKGGPMVDVIGGAILSAILALLAAGIALEWTWARWGSLVYAVVFGIIVMPVWVLGVLIPLRPRAPDYLFTGVFWTSLVVIGVSAIVL
jgi:hypothetical protein